MTTRAFGHTRESGNGMKDELNAGSRSFTIRMPAFAHLHRVIIYYIYYLFLIPHSKFEIEIGIGIGQIIILFIIPSWSQHSISFSKLMLVDQ